MRISDITALGRSIDLGYPTNLAIVVLTSLVAVAGAGLRLLSGAALLESARWGFGAGFAVFFAWALSRELDPDHNLSAFVGAGLMLVCLPFFDLPPLLVLLWLLLVLRIVNRTLGLPARPLDSLGVLGLGAWLTWQGGWMYGLMAAVAFLVDSRLAPPLRRHLLFSGMALLATLILAIFHGDIRQESGPSAPIILAVVAMAGLFAVAIATTRPVTSVGDVTGERLNPRRVQTAQILALLTALLTAWWAGRSGVAALLPLWSAMVGVALYRVVFLLRAAIDAKEGEPDDAG